MSESAVPVVEEPRTITRERLRWLSIAAYVRGGMIALFSSFSAPLRGLHVRRHLGSRLLLAKQAAECVACFATPSSWGKVRVQGVDPHGENAKEFALMTGLGMKPIDALRPATSVAADLSGIAPTTGTLEKGKRADIIGVRAIRPRTSRPRSAFPLS